VGGDPRGDGPALLSGFSRVAFTAGGSRSPRATKTSGAPAADAHAEIDEGGSSGAHRADTSRSPLCNPCNRATPIASRPSLGRNRRPGKQGSRSRGASERGDLAERQGRRHRPARVRGALNRRGTGWGGRAVPTPPGPTPPGNPKAYSPAGRGDGLALAAMPCRGTEAMVSVTDEVRPQEPPSEGSRPVHEPVSTGDRRGRPPDVEATREHLPRRRVRVSVLRGEKRTPPLP
jgi:hypothetical protein